MSEQKLVRDLMTVGVPTYKWETPSQDIARFLLAHHVETMCVLDMEKLSHPNKSRARLSAHKKGDYHD